MDPYSIGISDHEIEDRIEKETTHRTSIFNNYTDYTLHI